MTSFWRGRRSSSKLGNKRVTHSGYSFASKFEAAVFDVLCLRVRAGEICEIQVQPSVYLTKARILYKPDFKCITQNSHFYVEAKGFETDVWKIKKRLWKFYADSRLEIWKGTYTNPRHVETIVPVLDPTTDEEELLTHNGSDESSEEPR